MMGTEYTLWSDPRGSDEKCHTPEICDVVSAHNEQSKLGITHKCHNLRRLRTKTRNGFDNARNATRKMNKNKIRLCSEARVAVLHVPIDREPILVAPENVHPQALCKKSSTLRQMALEASWLHPGKGD